MPNDAPAGRAQVSPADFKDGVYVEAYCDTAEQGEVLAAFIDLLNSASRDGGRKRAAGLKPSWKVDDGHARAVFSHLRKWIKGDLVDEDSGAPTLVHLAWRALAIAWQDLNPEVSGSPNLLPSEANQEGIEALGFDFACDAFVEDGYAAWSVANLAAFLGRPL